MYIWKKRNIFWLLLMGIAIFPTVSVAANFHAILVGDTNDDNIGESVSVDLKNLQSLIDDIVKHTGLTLYGKIIQGNSLNRDKVMKAINSISAGPDDVVFFYWSGHGFNDGKSVLPTMYLGNQPGLPLLDVAKTIRDKKPRLFIAIGDTCNNQYDASRTLPSSREQAKPENYKTLFLKYRGEVLAAGSEAKKGGYSYGNKEKGGYYTNAFFNSLRIELALDGRPSWKALMDRTTTPIKISGNIVQQPIANADQTFYIGSANHAQQTNCEKAIDAGETCSGFDGNLVPSEGTADKCTDKNDPKCWGQ